MRRTWPQVAAGGLLLASVVWWGLLGPYMTQTQQGLSDAAQREALKLAAVPWSGLELERIRDMPSWLVSGAGDAGYNGTYTESGTYGGQPAYTNGSKWLFYTPGMGTWGLAGTLGGATAYDSTGATLPGTWGVGGGTAPAPTVAEAAEPFPGNLTLTINTPVDGVTVAGLFDVSYSIQATFAKWAAGLFSVFADLGGTSYGSQSCTVTNNYGQCYGSGTFTGLDSSLVADGERTLTLTAWQVSGGETLTDTAALTVDNAAPTTAAPTCAITAPADGAMWRGDENVYVVAHGQTPLTSVKLYADYGQAGEALLHTWTPGVNHFSGYCTVDTKTLTDGLRTLTAVAET